MLLVIFSLVSLVGAAEKGPKCCLDLDCESTCVPKSGEYCIRTQCPKDLLDKGYAVCPEGCGPQKVQLKVWARQAALPLLIQDKTPPFTAFCDPRQEQMCNKKKTPAETCHYDETPDPMGLECTCTRAGMNGTEIGHELQRENIDFSKFCHPLTQACKFSDIKEALIKKYQWRTVWDTSLGCRYSESTNGGINAYGCDYIAASVNSGCSPGDKCFTQRIVEFDSEKNSGNKLEVLCRDKSHCNDRTQTADKTDFFKCPSGSDMGHASIPKFSGQMLLFVMLFGAWLYN